MIASTALLVATLIGGGVQVGDPTPTDTGQPRTGTPTAPTDQSDVVDPDVTALGWVPEPITRDADTYARAALEAAGTFDTRLATREEWVAWLGTWFTPSPLYEDPQDALDQMAGYKTELNESVVLPQELWDALAREDGRVTARVAGDLAYLELPETTEQRMWTATADVVMTYTRAAEGGEVRYEETVRVSVQVVCDGASVPTPDSAQQAGDCKVVRFFDEAVG